MPNVIIASTNPVKINCTKQAFEKMFPGVDLSFEGVNAPSGVSEQPIGTEETILGARNRAYGVRQTNPSADYWVGIEGGIITDEADNFIAVAWVVILDKTGIESKASTGTFKLPKAMAEDIRNGIEMGAAADKLHGTTNVKQDVGTVGLLTDKVLNRTDYYAHAAILALIPFKNPKLY